jgi:hypothetical protein
MSGMSGQPDDETLKTVGSLAEISSAIWSRRYRFVRDLCEGGMGRILLVERFQTLCPFA